MFQSNSQAPQGSGGFRLPTYHPDRLYHILLGDYAALTDAINRMEVLKYCDRIAWITPVPTGRSGEYITIASRRIILPED